MRLKKLFVLIPTLIALTGCDIQSIFNNLNSNEENTSSEVSNSGESSAEEGDTLPITGIEKDYTVMIYLCGADLESQSGYASSNIAEILTVNLPSNVNVIIETGGASKWKKYNISSTKLSRYHVENKGLKLDTTLTYASMGASSTFQSFVEWGLTKYPAKKTGVVFWDHGAAMDGCCFDEKKNNDGLTNYEVQQAFKNAFKKTGRTSKLEWVGYDCCLMQVADIASYNSEFFNYMVASQEMEGGPGWDYQSWLGDLAANPNIDTRTLLSNMSDSYVEKNGEEYSSASQNDGTLSVLDLSKMPEFDAKFNALTKKLRNKVDSSSFTKLFSNSEVIRFGKDGRTYYYDCYDAKTWCSFLEKSGSSYKGLGASELLDVLDDLIISHTNGEAHKNACGLSIVGMTSGTTEKESYEENQTPYSDWQYINCTYGSFYRGY